MQTPAPLEYERATSVDGAIAALVRLGGGRRSWASGWEAAVAARMIRPYPHPRRVRPRIRIVLPRSARSKVR